MLMMLYGLRRLQFQGDAVQRKHAKHMPNCDTRLSRLDAGNGLHVDTETGRSSGLPIAGGYAGTPCRSTHVLDRLQGVVANVWRNSLALGHSWILSVLGFVGRFDIRGRLAALTNFWTV